MVRHQGAFFFLAAGGVREGYHSKARKKIRMILESRLENLAHSFLKQIPSRTWLSLLVSLRKTLSRQSYLWVLGGTVGIRVRREQGLHLICMW